MGQFLDKIKEEIVSEFGIRNMSNLEIISQANNGFSGAEVYCIELKNDSNRRGTFYLKIDISSDEYENSKESAFARKGVCYLEKKKIKEYYVMLIDLAGKSVFEYTGFYSLESPVKRKEIVKLAFDELLEDAAAKEDLKVEEKIEFMKLVHVFLQSKLKKNGKLHEYLQKILEGSSDCTAPAIQLGDIIVPNPYAYAVDVTLCNEKFSRLSCYQHGDFHGDNFFVSKEENEYAIIDFALCRKDGYLFFDSAYFSLSLLLYVFQEQTVTKFVENVTKIIEKDWNDIEFRYLEVIREIDEVENTYIDKVCDEYFRNNDALKQGKYIARVLAGLNYAGKKKVNDDLREKAFLFASLYLKKLFESMDFKDWKDRKRIKWNRKQEVQIDIAYEVEKFIKEINYFSSEQSCILVVGDDCEYEDGIVDGIMRISWSGIISFCNNDKVRKLKNSIETTRLLKPIALGVSDNLDSIEQNTTWWMFANGLSSDPDTIEDTFPKWHKKYRYFIGDNIKQIEKTFSPEDITIIIDWNSFKDCKRHLEKLLEEFDFIETAQVNIAVLNLYQVAAEINNDNYPNLCIKHFRMGIQNLASYCKENLPSVRHTKSYIPHVENKLGVLLDEEDEYYVNQYVTLVNEELLEEEKFDSYSKRYSFYWGEPISWTAISEKLYIDRKEIKGHVNKIRNIIQKEKSCEQKILNIPHSPGAGATVLCKTVCWELRKEYPTIIISSINDNVYESFRRLSSKSGKYLIILLDGDFSRNDVTHLKGVLHNRGIKCVILYTYRQYQIERLDKDREIQTLDVLSIDEGLLFKTNYMDKVKERKLYSYKEEKKRGGNLFLLTTNMELLRFRMPFFYGMYAFEKDFTEIDKYLKGIVEKIDKEDNMKKIINYMCLISYFTTEKGIFPKLVKNILGFKKESSNYILKHLQEQFPNMIYSIDHTYRICHPVIAMKILEQQFSFSSSNFVTLCKEFIKDLKKCDGDQQDSFAKLDDLLMAIFIQRNTEDDLQEEGIKKENFSQIFLAIENNYSKEEVFQCLVENFPNNAHFAHHFGRLIIANSPVELDRAKEQFDKAIKLEPKNNIHFHARGNAYEKFVIDLVLHKCSDNTPLEIYNKTFQLVDLSLEDYKKSIEISELNTDIISLKYPFTSIVKICTFMINQIIRSSGMMGKVNEFFGQNTIITKWCDELRGIANSYDIDTEYLYEDIRKNEKYNKAKAYLLTLNCCTVDLKQRIKREPENKYLKISYLNTVIVKRDEWQNKSQEELEDICGFCEELMLLEKENTRQGIIWKWFNAYNNLKRFDYIHFFSILESLPQLENNLTANYFLYIGYFLKYGQILDESLVKKVKERIVICQKLGRNNSNFRLAQWYYLEPGKFKVAIESKVCKKVKGTVISEIENIQSGRLSLDLNPNFKAFFVPKYTDLKKGQSFGKSLDLVIGFSYDGLRAYDVESRK